jgi:hypothetical protein
MVAEKTFPEAMLNLSRRGKLYTYMDARDQFVKNGTQAPHDEFVKWYKRVRDEYDGAYGASFLVDFAKQSK